jgi:hypothetical protein
MYSGRRIKVEEACSGTNLVLPIPAPVSVPGYGNAPSLTSYLTLPEGATFFLPTAESGELREIPGLGTVIETCHPDGTVTRYMHACISHINGLNCVSDSTNCLRVPISAAIPIEEHSLMPPDAHSQHPTVLPSFNRYQLGEEEGSETVDEQVE